MIDLEKHRIEATKIIIEAAQILKEDRELGQDISYKKDKSPVTLLDKKLEIFIRESLFAIFPNTGFIGEEHDAVNQESDYQWICDPIDGTRSFIEGKKTVAISLALFFKKIPMIGFINNPITNELFIGSKAGVFYNDVKIEAKPIRSLANVSINHQMRHQSDFLKKLKDAEKKKQIKKLYHQGGSVAYNFVSILKGEAEAYVWSHRKSVNSWDIAGGIALIKYWGGCVTDLDGNEIRFTKETSLFVASTNPIIHQQVLLLLNQ